MRTRVTAMPSETEQVRKSLKYSILDGSAYSAMLGLTQDYIVPFALALKATVLQVGLLSSIPSLIMALSQLGAPRLAEKIGSRKRLILPVVFLHALMWVPLLLIPYLFPGEKIWWLIGLFTLSTVLGLLGNPAWGSLMADLVPEKMRGRYFGLRGKICGFVTLVFFFIGGATLQFSTANIFLGFSLLFGAAVVFRLVSCYFLSKMHEPTLSHEKTEHYGMKGILKNLYSSNLGKFIIGISLMNFATNLAGPFFAVYMLRDLKLDYLIYVAIISTATMANLTFMTFWGKRADRFGNIKIIKVTSVLVSLVPLLWIGSHQLYYLIPVQILSGFAWAGFNLASTNFVYDASAPERRMRYIAVFNAMNGSAVCLGALLGGCLAAYLPPLLGYNILTLFLISGLLRGLVAATFLRHISEVRQVPKTSTAELLFGRLGFAQIKSGAKGQLIPYLILTFKTKRVPAVLSLPPAWWHELTAPSRDPPE